MLRYPRSSAAEAYRGLLARVGFASEHARTLMVASTDTSDGGGVVAANLAIAFSDSGRKVILVDADHQSPRLHSYFGVPNDRGVTNVLVDRDTPLSWVMVPTAHQRLRLVPAGPPAPGVAGPLDAGRLDELIRSMLQVADLVVFRSPSVSLSLDAATLAKRLRETVLVVPTGARADETAQAVLALQSAETEVVGAILYRKVRGSHKRSDAAAVAAVPRGGGAPWPATPAVQPRLIPAVVTKTDPPVARRPSGAAAGLGPRHVYPPRAPGPDLAGAAAPRSPRGPYATPYEQPGSTSRR
jgi:capsular exopolysaccharide synthesis family protein